MTIVSACCLVGGMEEKSEVITLRQAMEILGYKTHKSVYILEQRGQLTPVRNPAYVQKRWMRSQVEELAKARKAWA